jgi:hypothetical protein
LDAVSAKFAEGLVDKAMLAETQGLSGQGCFDVQFGRMDLPPDIDSGSGHWDIHQAAQFARSAIPGYRGRTWC